MARSGVVCDTVCTGDQVKALMEQCGDLLPRNFGEVRGEVVTRYSLQGCDTFPVTGVALCASRVL